LSSLGKRKSDKFRSRLLSSRPDDVTSTSCRAHLHVCSFRAVRHSSLRDDRARRIFHDDARTAPFAARVAKTQPHSLGLWSVAEIVENDQLTPSRCSSTRSCPTLPDKEGIGMDCSEQSYQGTTKRDFIQTPKDPIHNKEHSQRRRDGEVPRATRWRLSEECSGPR
jgi:hypothetical protein